MRALVVAAVLAAGVSSACSSAPEPAGPEPAPSTSGTTAGHGAYATCLAEHGVSTPPVGPGAPPGVDPQTWASAQQACAPEAPGPVG